MSLKALVTGELRRNVRFRSVALQRTYATTSESVKEEIVDITSVDTNPTFKEKKLSDEQQNIAQQMNKSGLNEQHRNILRGQRPYEDDGPAYHHYFIDWKRKMLGRYGITGSNVDPGVAWPTEEEVADMKEYEKVAYPLSLQDSFTQISAVKAAKAMETKIREDDIAAKLAKTAQWEKELYAKIAKKETEMRVTQERKERLVEEVRRHFGFKVDPRDEKFKQMLELKEKEDKKRRKEAKKKERSEMMIAKMLSKSKEETPVFQSGEEKSSPMHKDLS